MKTLLFQLVLLAVYPLLGGHTLFDGGKSRYCIVVARDASASERTAGEGWRSERCITVNHAN